MDETRFTHRNPVWAPEWWEMKIHDVQKSDEGYYTCQKESDPEIKKVIYLRVIGEFNYLIEIILSPTLQNGSATKLFLNHKKKIIFFQTL